MKITNGSGQYWTGECWGVVQNAQEYDTIEDLPLEIDGAEIEQFADDEIRYFENEEDEAAIAWVVDFPELECDHPRVDMIPCEGPAGAFSFRRECSECGAIPGDDDEDDDEPAPAPTWRPHDGVSEWGDCRKCGAHLDGASDNGEMTADGGCEVCGAGPEDVGLVD